MARTGSGGPDEPVWLAIRGPETDWVDGVFDHALRRPAPPEAGSPRGVFCSQLRRRSMTKFDGLYSRRGRAVQKLGAGRRRTGPHTAVLERRDPHAEGGERRVKALS